MITIVEHKKRVLEIDDIDELSSYVETNMSVHEYSPQAIKEVQSFANRIIKRAKIKKSIKKKRTKKEKEEVQQTFLLK